MRVRSNRVVERAGVNACQAFFESENWIFQPIDQGNDYGKDAYIDASDGQTVMGLCATLQIKSGSSFRRATGYVIPIGDHERAWRESPLPGGHRVIRRLSNVVSAVSLLLAVVTAVLWTLSYSSYVRFVIRNSGSRVQLVEGSCVLCRPPYRVRRLVNEIVTPVILEIPLSPLAVAFGLLPSIWVVQRLLRRPRNNGFCGCGYNLTANTSGVCPECGTAVPNKPEAIA